MKRDTVALTFYKQRIILENTIHPVCAVMPLEKSNSGMHQPWRWSYRPLLGTVRGAHYNATSKRVSTYSNKLTVIVMSHSVLADQHLNPWIISLPSKTALWHLGYGVVRE